MPADVASSSSGKNQRRHRRWRFQWGLRTLLVSVTLAAVVLAVWGVYVAPLRREAVLIRRLNKLGAQIKTVPGEPQWVSRMFGEDDYRHIVEVDLWLPKRGPFDISAFKDLPKLRSLALTNVEISDEQLVHPQDFPNLRFLALRNSDVTIGAAVELAEAKPDLLFVEAMSEGLYSSAFDEFQQDWISVDRALECFRAAAAWKIALSRLNGSSDRELTAAEDYVSWCDKFVRAVESMRKKPGSRLSKQDVVVARCGLDEAELRLQRLTDQSHPSSALFDRALSNADELGSVSRAAFDRNELSLPAYVYALQLARNMQFLLGNLEENPDATEAVLDAYATEMRRLLERTRPLFETKARRGEDETFFFLSVAAPQAEADAVRHRGDSERELQLLEHAAEQTARLREAAHAAVNVYVISLDAMILMNETASDVERRLAELQNDSVQERVATFSLHDFLDAMIKETIAREPTTMGRDVTAVPLLRCRLATQLLRDEREAFLASPLRRLDVPWTWQLRAPLGVREAPAPAMPQRWSRPQPLVLE